MPITGIGSYPKTTEDFEINWTQADIDLLPSSITLAGNYDKDDFTEDRTQLLAWIAEVPGMAQAARDTAALRDNLKVALMARIRQFRGAVEAQITDSYALSQRPMVPNFTDDQTKFSAPLEKMEELWTRLNANAATFGLSGPMTLQGNYTLALFQADVVALAARYKAANVAEGQVNFSRSHRNTAMAAIYERMKQYRAAAPAMLPPNSAALQNLPRLSPEAGTTPPSVVVTGVYDALAGEAVFSFAASTAKNLDKLQARGCTGTVYKAEDEEVIGDLLPTATEFRTDWGLSAPGAKIAVKIYVMTTTGNENGSKAVKIVRPEV